MNKTPSRDQPNVWWKAGAPPIWENDHGGYSTVRHDTVIALEHHPDEDDDTLPLQQTGQDWQRFHEQTALTTVYGHWPPELQQAYAGLGLTNEAGEVAGKLKKLLRDDNGHLHPERREAIIDECGDVLWYLARVLESVDSDLWDAAERNMAKVARRQQNATLNGDGDHR